jgi:hypothetical protein
MSELLIKKENGWKKSGVNRGEVFAFAIINEGVDTDNNHLEFNSREADAYKPELVIE